jgi:hypothetical protein
VRVEGSVCVLDARDDPEKQQNAQDRGLGELIQSNVREGVGKPNRKRFVGNNGSLFGDEGAESLLQDMEQLPLMRRLVVLQVRPPPPPNEKGDIASNGLREFRFRHRRNDVVLKRAKHCVSAHSTHSISASHDTKHFSTMRFSAIHRNSKQFN